MTSNSRTISFGLVDGHAIFMDERTDSYFMLDGPDEQYFLTRIAEGLPLLDNRLSDALLVGGEPASISRADNPEPRRSLVEMARTGQRPAFAEIVRLARLVRDTRKLLGSNPIDEILAHASRFEPANDEDGWAVEDLIRKAGRFMAARRLIPIKANCLLDSLAMLRWLGAAKRRTMLVFGAKLDPFAAHCWLQTGDMLLNDRLENVTRFGPVRALRCSPATH